MVTETVSPRFQEHGRIAVHAHASRCAGRKYIARHQRHGLRQIRDQIGYFEDQVGRIGVLPGLAVEGQGDVQITGIGYLVGCHQIGADRKERVRRFAPHPLPVALLNVAGGHVVGAQIARYMLHRLSFGNLAPAPARPADHDRQFRLVIYLVRHAGQTDHATGIVERVAVLGEQNGAFGDGLVLLLAVIAVVLPDAHDLGRVAHRREQPNFLKRKTRVRRRIRRSLPGRIEALLAPRQKRRHGGRAPSRRAVSRFQ